MYAVLKDRISMDGVERDLRDVMNPSGMFLGGKRQREYSITGDLLPSSGKLIPEFFGRRNIRDMFVRKAPLHQSRSHQNPFKDGEILGGTAVSQESSITEMLGPTNGIPEEPCDSAVIAPSKSPSAVVRKRSAPVMIGSIRKRGKSGSAINTPPLTSKGQQSLKGFFKPSAILDSNVVNAVQRERSQTSLDDNSVDRALRSSANLVETDPAPDLPVEAASLDSAIHTPCQVFNPGRRPSPNPSPEGNYRVSIQPQESIHDPVEIKESWSKLFTKPTAPRCEGHDEPCISLLTKKPGINLGRSFWMCRRPLGPSGAKEKNTQWRCQTFIWCSDWNTNVANL